MNGELLQVCRIVASAKKALKENKKIIFESFKYEDSITFQLIEKKSWFGKKPFKASNVAEWFDECCKRGLEDIKCLTPMQVEDRNLLGFSNSRQNIFVCFYKSGHVTYNTVHWDFQKERHAWTITYTEHRWDNPPQEKPEFYDNTADLVNVLNEIEKFAHFIECDHFANLFHEAALAAEGESTKEMKLLIDMPKKNLNLFKAASTADVFGAMGSWNDSPPYMAHEKNVDEQYEHLSAELFRQLCLATLYAVNEW
ncbi:hypothetical protein NOM01_13000 [Sporolactobacillus sp. STSJ-5]|uniref:hypothetical protein n=1 Tax=Sporolactobacillus sp. STSJ-5 TaxID=2965076 RepID=UPI002106CF82|nr:hypothetical protein [Sporolactobacillus sp. STSJ-5]MCQ2010926.1 hypothetical protein [Sporolactobacillus sp. STSJ-5]